jgi:hypothetical protein
VICAVESLGQCCRNIEYRNRILCEKRVDIAEKVLERLATPDKTTIVIEKQPDGKMRVTSGSWEKIFPDQVIEVRHANASSRLHVARKTKAAARLGATL